MYNKSIRIGNKGQLPIRMLLHNRHFRHGHLLKMILNVAFVFVIREFIRPSHPGSGYLQRYCGQRLPPEAPDRSHRKPEEAFPQIP